MIAQFGPLGSAVQVTTPLPQDRQDGVTAENARPLSEVTVEIANPTPAVEQAQTVDNAPERNMLPDLLPPNPQAPAGPPPAFEASILDRAREVAFRGTGDVTSAPELPQPQPEPVQNTSGTAPEEDFELSSQPVVAPEAEPESELSYDVPPSRMERAEEQVTTLRRIETPYDTATVDVSR
ncbi:MAG: hypothetical protein AAGA87_13740 [Pseudomonadota bacterium]